MRAPKTLLLITRLILQKEIEQSTPIHGIKFSYCSHPEAEVLIGLWNALLNTQLRYQPRKIFLMGVSNILEDTIICFNFLNPSALLDERSRILVPVVRAVENVSTWGIGRFCSYYYHTILLRFIYEIAG